MTKLYYHKTDGGAEYLTDTYYTWNCAGKRRRAGCFNHKTKYVVRIDGDITKTGSRLNASLTIRKTN